MNHNGHDILDREETFLLLKEINSNPQFTQRHLSQRLAISLGKINFLVNALIDKGIIKVKNFKNSKSKIAYAYLLTPHGINVKLQLTHKFLTRKVQEYGKLKQEIESFQKEIFLGGGILNPKKDKKMGN